MVLAICCLAVFMVGLDSTALNVALPAIQRELHASVSGLQWTIDTYNLLVASLMVLAGATADRIGRRRVFLAGFLVFTAGSVLCGLASTVGQLVACRAVQALGGAILGPVCLSIITHAVPDELRRAHAIGVWTSAFAMGMAAGPLLGGALVSGAGWRSVFWINLPVGLAALALAARYVPESRAEVSRRFDVIGQLLVVALLGPLTFAITDAPHRGLFAAPVLVCGTVALAALAGLLGYERRLAEPLIDLRFFRSAPFSGSVAISLCAFATLGGFLFLSTLDLQNARGFSPLAAGLRVLPMPVMTVICAPLSGWLVSRRGPRTPLLLAGAALTAGGLVFALCGTECRGALPVLGYVCFGAGIGLADVPATGLAVSGMPRARAGVASAITTASCRVGVSLGVAVTGAVLAAGLPDPAHPGPAAFAAAARPAWWIIAGCGAAVLLLGALVTGAWARGTALRAAALQTALPGRGAGAGRGTRSAR